MDPTENSKLPRIILIALIALIVLALGVLAWVLLRTAQTPAEASAPPSPSISASPILATATPAPTAEPTPKPTPTPSPTPVPTATPAPTPVPVELGETEDAGQEYIDRLVFLGDSTTYGLAAYGLVPLTQVWTDSMGTLALFNWAIDPIAYYDPSTPYYAESLYIAQCAARRQPEILIITLGINGIAFLDETEFKSYYTDMIDAILAASPDTRIICNSIYPVMDRYVPGGISTDGVNAANGWIYDVAKEKDLRYLNCHDALMDEDGQLRSDYSDDTAMGIHLNATGLDALLAYIRTHALQ